MAINPQLLVAAPMLQDYLVDKDTGLPLTGGLINLYIDTNRQTRKNWYYQTGVANNYTFLALDNPLKLSASGTIQDPHGNDVIPFYYPFQENDQNIPEFYFITVDSVDSNGNPNVRQFTRENFPPHGSETSTTLEIATLRNYIVNNTYWRNIGSLDCKLVTDQVIAPSQHDGYTNGDIRFKKGATGATESLSFIRMESIPATLIDDITPEFCLNMQCTAPQSGEQYKYIQYPISLHVEQLQDVDFTAVIHAQNVSGNPNGYLDIYLWQYLGTGVVSPDPVRIDRLILSPEFLKYPLTFTFPTAPTVLGNGKDDAFFLLVQYPLDLTFNINHTKPEIYLSDKIPTNDFDTYDDIAAIVNSPRTGDLRISMNDHYYFGWVPMNDGTIGNDLSNATARDDQDTWPLFNFLWSKFKPYDNGGINILAQMVNSAGSNTSYGTDAITDFNANKAMTLMQTMGEVLLGTAPFEKLLTPYKTYFVATNVGSVLVVTCVNNVNFFQGMPVYFLTTGTLPGGLFLNTIYYVSAFNGTSGMAISTTFANAMAGTVIPFTGAGTGTNAIVSCLPASYEGEYGHRQLTGEVGSHTHGITISQWRDLVGSVGSNNSIAVNQGISQVPFSNIVASIDNNLSPNTNSFANVTQPGMFFNFYMKL